MNCLDCGKIVSSHSTGRCISCSNRQRNITHKGEKSYFWKGREIGYKHLHGWINDILGKAATCNEIGCTKTSKTFEWGNISGKYLRDILDFRSMCHSCNIKMANRKRSKNGRFVKCNTN